MTFLESIKNRAKADVKTIVLPESMDRRTFEAAETILKEGIANLIIIGTPEEIAESDLRVALIGELIKARQEKGITQKQLEELSGVKQPVIARMEKGTSIPKVDTILKVLAPLGKKLAVVSIED